jgi:anthranilate phosphoribosyltransferase
MLKPYLNLLVNKQHLSKEEAKAAMTVILEETEPHQTAAFLAILKYRGETAEEIAGMVDALEEKARPANLEVPVLDIVGTGGDLANTVNISTGSAILAAACGIPIAKHGNRSVSSRSGSADVLEALNIDIEVPSDKLRECLRETGMGFMFAPNYHPSLKKLGTIRRGLKLPTLMNILGPLLNPAKAEYALIGVANEPTLKLMSQVVLQQANIKRALVFHGCGLDELTTLGKMIGYEILGGEMRPVEIDPISLGFSRCTLDELQGGDAHQNASILKQAFSGKQGAVADALILNAGAAVWIFGLVPTLEEGIEVARNVLREGGAIKVLEKLVAFSNKIRTGEKCEQQIR